MMPWNQPYVCYPVEDPTKKKEKKKKETKIEYEFWDQDTHNKVYGSQAYYGVPYAQYYPSAVSQQSVPATFFQGQPFIVNHGLQCPTAHYPAVPANISAGVQGLPITQGEAQRYWVGEIDNSWTLRTMAEINAECQPGGWEYGESGFPFFRRKKD